MMIEWLLVIKKEDKFKDKVADWRIKTAASGQAEFIAFFEERDPVVHHLTKIKLAKATDAWFHSVT